MAKIVPAIFVAGAGIKRFQNARKPIKGSKNLDFSLVFNKNLSKTLPSCGWSLGPNTFGQTGAETYLTHGVRHKKPETQKLIIFFIAN